MFHFIIVYHIMLKMIYNTPPLNYILANFHLWTYNRYNISLCTVCVRKYSSQKWFNWSRNRETTFSLYISFDIIYLRSLLILSEYSLLIILLFKVLLIIIIKVDDTRRSLTFCRRSFDISRRYCWKDYSKTTSFFFLFRYQNKCVLKYFLIKCYSPR